MKCHAITCLLFTLTSDHVIAYPSIADEQRHKDLRLRVTEHSVMVVAKYYTRVTIKRLSELLDLPAADAEKQLSELVVSKAICAKVDRPSGLIVFGKRKVGWVVWA